MKTTINKMIALSVSMLFCMSIFIVPVAEAGKYDFIKKIAAKDKREIARMAKSLPSLKQTFLVESLSQRLNIPKHLLVSPAVRKMAITGEEIVSHGVFSTKFLNKSAVPELVIQQYVHYGKEHFIIVAEKVSKVMTKYQNTNITALLKLKKVYKGMDKVISSYNLGKYNNDLFVRNIRKTGKRGMKVFGWLVEQPKTAMVGAVTAWYLTDPEGFEYALHQSGQTIGTFVSETLVTTSSGIGEGLIAGISHTTNTHSLGSIFGGGAVLAIIVLAFLVKTFRRILLFPFYWFGIKANAKMNDLEQTSSACTTTKPHASEYESRQRKPRSNL